MTQNKQAKIVVIGGGVIGTSVAYHLALAGETDVILLEKAQLTHGSTWHAAGLVGQLRGKRNLTRLMQNSVSVFDRLEKESGQVIDWRKVGSLRLASSPERWSEIRRSMSQAKSFGVECETVSATEAKDLFPFIVTQGIEGAAFIPGDGYIDPYALTQAFAKVAKEKGIQIQEHTTVSGFDIKNRRIVSVITDQGNIACEKVINCAGLWAKRVGEMAGVPLAAGVVEHQYFLTEKKLDFDKSLPTLRDPDKNFYLKPDTGAFAIGGWEEGSRVCWQSRPPLEFGRDLFEANLDRLELFAIPTSERLPVINEIGIQTIINGPIPVSADGEPIMGLAPQLDNLFVACGFTAGIAASGGAGQAMANWMIYGDPGMDLWAFDVRRFGELHAQPGYLAKRAIDAYAAYYKIHWPGEQTKVGRGLRRSPIYTHLKQAGAIFGAKFGWERADCFITDDVEFSHKLSFEGKPGYFETVAHECQQLASNVVLIDQSSFSKFQVTGSDAYMALNRIATNRIPQQPGEVVYTQLCNEQGGIEADLTIIHVAKDNFIVVTGSGFGVHDRHWIETHLPAKADLQFHDVTNAYAVINLCGPNSRKVLDKVTDADVSHQGFQFLSSQQIDIGDARVLAVRIGYVGELGWELYVPQEYAAFVYETLWESGKEFGISNAGYRAIESCRLEKGYVYWSADVGPDNNPYEAGLGFCVDLEKDDFIGKQALSELAASVADKKRVTLFHDGFIPLHGSEPIYLNSELSGSVTSAGFGHRLGLSIAYGYLPHDVDEDAHFEIESFGTTYTMQVGNRCLYDPKMKRLKN